MKIVSLVVAICVIAACGTAFADNSYPYKWSQMPEMVNPWGFDVESNLSNTIDVVAADDWVCVDGAPITDVHWWGSYLGNDPVEGFRISIHADIPAGIEPSHPGVLLESYMFDLSDTHQVFYGQDAYGQDVYQYFVWLPQPFYQVQGTVYWLDIEALNPDATDPFWGWHTAILPHNIDDAVQLFGYDALYGSYTLFTPLEMPPYGSLDLAFELTIPEPTTMILMLGALLPAAAAIRRRISR
jgi:hypothetical protein